jgi:hypothetical protein
MPHKDYCVHCHRSINVLDFIEHIRDNPNHVIFEDVSDPESRKFGKAELQRVGPNLAAETPPEAIPEAIPEPPEPTPEPTPEAIPEAEKPA